MLLPSELQRIINVVIEELQRHPQHALSPFQRRVVYEYLAEQRDTDPWLGETSPWLEPPDSLPDAALDVLFEQFGQIRNPIAWRRRIKLDLLTAQRMLRLWQEERPEDSLGQRMYDLAEGTALGVIDRELAAKEARSVFSWYEDAEYAWTSAFYALEAIMKSITTAREVNVWDRMDIKPNDDDVDIDPSDVAASASFAVAGDVRDLNSNSAKRLEFWTWWLTEAIPTAWTLREPFWP